MKAVDLPHLPRDWRTLTTAARRLGWELGHQSRYGGPWRCYAWRGRGFAGDREIGTLDDARAWVAAGCPPLQLPLWDEGRVAA